MFQLTENEIVGSTISNIFGKDIFDKLIKPHVDNALLGSIERYEAWFDFKTKGKRYLSVTYFPFSEKRGSISNGVVVASNDSTKLKLSEERLEILSSTDQLTNINNRRNFLFKLNEEIERSKRFGHTFTLLSIDIDNFKSINDFYGHNIGDLALVYTARILQNTFRKVDTLGRVGGEEFSVIIPESSFVQIEKLLERAIRAFNNNIFNKNGIHFKITVSIGATVFPKDADNLTDLMNTADKALYSAKKNGKNQFSAYTPTGD